MRGGVLLGGSLSSLNFWGKTVPFWVMKKSLENIWKTSKPFVTRDLDNGFFVVSFEEEEDLNYVYHGGPWMISDHYLIVQRWRPNFDPWSAQCQKKIAAWVRIPLLPLEFFNMAALKKIGAGIGRSLKIDSITYTSERGRYARICVELDLQKRLKASVKILGRKRFIEYEGLHLICFNCGKYGHHRDECPEKMKKDVNKQSNGESNDEGIMHEEVKENSNMTVKGANMKVEMLKRARGAEDFTEVGGAPPEYDGLGSWNLVRRQTWRSYRNPMNWGRQADSLEKNMGGKSQGDMNREYRVGSKKVISNDKERENMGSNQKKEACEFDHATKNKMKWVPVDHNKRDKEKERMAGRKIRRHVMPNNKSHVGPSGIVKEKSSFLHAPNPFEALMDINEDDAVLVQVGQNDKENKELDVKMRAYPNRQESNQTIEMDTGIFTEQSLDDNMTYNMTKINSGPTSSETPGLVSL